MRKALLAVVAAAGFGTAAVLPALGAGAEPQTVTARDFSFVEREVAVKPGETVTWVHGGSFSHNVRFDDGRFLDPPSPQGPTGAGWLDGVSYTFPADTPAGSYRYYCEEHGGGMAGIVHVNDTGTVPTPTPSPSPAPSPSPSPTPTPAPSGAPTPAPSPAPPEGVAIRRLSLLRGRFCTRRGRTCRRPGVVLLVDLSAPARVSGTLARRPMRGGRFRRFGTVTFGTVRAGPRRLTFTRTRSGRRLTPGRYRLSLRVGPATRALAFRVRAS